MSSSTPAKLQQQRSFNLDAALDRCVDANLLASPITASGAAATVGAQSDPTQVALFHAFVKALRPSIRGAFIATHSPQAVVDCMRGVFACAVQPRAPGAIVAHVEAAPSASGGVDGGGGAVAATVVMTDQAFVVDTTNVFLAAVGRKHERGLASPLPMRRDAATHALLAVGRDALDATPVSYICFEAPMTEFSTRLNDI